MQVWPILLQLQTLLDVAASGAEASGLLRCPEVGTYASSLQVRFQHRPSQIPAFSILRDPLHMIALGTQVLGSVVSDVGRLGGTGVTNCLRL